MKNVHYAMKNVHYGMKNAHYEMKNAYYEKKNAYYEKKVYPCLNRGQVLILSLQIFLTPYFMGLSSNFYF